jgi:hypothetical protein
MRHRHRGHRGEAGLRLCGDIRAEQGASRVAPVGEKVIADNDRE